MKRAIWLATWLYPGIVLAAHGQAPLARPFVYRLVDTGFFVLFAIATYIAAIIIAEKTMKALGDGTMYKLLKWLTWGLWFGVGFQAFIFIFDFKKVAGLTAAQISVGWHLFFSIAILLMVIGAVIALRRIKKAAA